MINRTTTDIITELYKNEVFVFGSNLSGRHAGGAAWFALNHGAVEGISDGLSGQSYAIPTVDKEVREPLDIETISHYVDKFTKVAKERSDLTFLVTEIGCGLAGFTPEDIAPLFLDCYDLENVHLPFRFWKVLIKQKRD
jgi:hypothetical protein